MELRISENQLKSLIRNTLKSEDLGEQEQPVNPEPEAGTSDTQSGGSGYPSVGKWESGVTRGPANQVGVTKWSDVVGANLKRGKANQLKEQALLNPMITPMTSKISKSISDFNFDEFLKSINWSEWGQWSLMGGSLLAALFIPGAQGLWISIGLDLIAAADLYFNEKDNLGAGIASVLAFIPVIGDALKIGKVSVKTTQKLTKLLSPLKTEEEILNTIFKLPKQEQYIVQQILKQDPKTLNRLIKGVVSSKITTKQEALKIALQINNLVKSGKLPKASAGAFYKNLNLKRFGFDLGVSGLILIGGWTYEAWSNKNMNRPDIPKDVLYYYQENIKLIEKINQKDFDNKVTPIINQYQELAYTNEMKFLKLYNFVLRTYIKNPNSDFDSLIKKNYNKF